MIKELTKAFIVNSGGQAESMHADSQAKSVDFNKMMA